MMYEVNDIVGIREVNPYAWSDCVGLKKHMPCDVYGVVKAVYPTYYAISIYSKETDEVLSLVDGFIDSSWFFKEEEIFLMGPVSNLSLAISRKKECVRFMTSWGRRD